MDDPTALADPPKAPPAGTGAVVISPSPGDTDLALGQRGHDHS